MSWLGGSLQSLTGQLSNLTKDILTEGTEEVSDHVTELRLAQDRIKELDTVTVSQKIEIDRLKLVVKEAEDKAEGSELQINKISREYRTLIEEKETEIKRLKVENQDFKSAGPFIGQQAQPAVLRLDSDNGFQSVGYGGDEHDFGDNVSMQHDINRLRADLHRIQAECKHWKSLVQDNTAEDGRSLQQMEKLSTDDTTLLHKQIQELQEEVSHEKDVRQHELSAMQDAHTHKLSQLRKKHKEEVAQLRTQIQDMDWGADGWQTQPSDDTASLKTTISSLKEQITQLQTDRQNHLTQITSLSEALQEQKSEVAVKNTAVLHLENQLKVSKVEITRAEEERDQVRHELLDVKHKLLDQLDANHADTLEVLCDLREVRQHMDMSAIDRRNKLLLEKENMVNQMMTLANKSKVLEAQVESLEGQNESMKQHTASLVEDMGNAQQQNITADIVDSLEHENLLLKEKNVSLQEQVSLLEKAMHNVSQQNVSQQSSHPVSSGVGFDADMASDSMSFTSDLSEMSRRNLELDEQVMTLEGQIAEYEVEIGKFELRQTKWLTERENMEDVLDELRSQLKHHENSLHTVEAQKGLLAVEKYEAGSISKQGLPDLVDEAGKDSLEDIADDVLELDTKVGLLTEANALLEQDRDELAQQQVMLKQEITDLKLKLNTDRSRHHSTTVLEPEDVNEKPSELTELLKEKEEELHALMCEKEDLVKNLAQVPQLKLELQQKQDEVESLLRSSVPPDTQHKSEEVQDLETDIQDLKKKLRGKNEEIVTLSLEKEEMMQSLEELDNQHQEAINHLISLKQQLTNHNQQLEQEKQTIKNELDIIKNQQLLSEADESLSSNELNHEIAELKQEIITLNQRLDKGRDAVGKLEADDKKKEDVIAEMKAKLESSGAALNDLHIDKQELQEHITKLKDDLGRQTEKLKRMRIEKEETLQQSAEQGEQSQESSSWEILKMEEENEDIHSQLDAVMQEGKQKAATISQLTRSLQELNEKHETLSQQLDEKESEEKLLKENIKQHEDALAGLKEQLVSVTTDCEQLQKESSRKHEECESFSRHLHVVESELQTLKTEHATVETENGILARQVETSNNEISVLTEKLNSKTEAFDKLHSEVVEVKDLLADATDKLHNTCEESSELLSELEKCRNELATVNNERVSDYDAQMMSATGELVLVKEELAAKSEEFERLDNELYCKDELIKQLEVDNANLVHSAEQNSKLASETTDDLQEQCKLLSGEKDRLQRELTSLEDKMQAQLKHYESYIEDLKSSKEENTSSLQLQYDEMREKCLQKELHLSEVDAKIHNILAQMEECQKELETSREECDALKLVCDNQKLNVSALEETITQLKLENTRLNQVLSQRDLSSDELTVTLDKLKLVENEKDSLEQAVKEINDKHNSVVSTKEHEIKILSAKIEEVETSVSSLRSNEQSEVASLIGEKVELNAHVEKLAGEVQHLNQIVFQKDSDVKHLTSEIYELTKMVEQYKAHCVEKDTDISALQGQLAEARCTNDEMIKDKDDRQEKEIVHELEESKHNTQLLATSAPNAHTNNDNLEHERNIIIEIERLKGQLDEKDNIISELRRNNASLLKMLDTKSKSTGDMSHIEIVKLENEVKALKLEREQMMDVLNEKSRESSNLKAEVQRLMTVLTAQKTAMEKLQKDNHELSMSSPDTDAAHIDDMQKEVVQNLSRIIRDKDLEIESLQQKNQTLLSVLQESSTEGSQINSLMQDKENLMKQMAALQSEREQMITYLNQKHQESVAYHTEVQRLTALVNSENERNEQVRTDYEILKPQFEDKTQALVKTQNELLNYKQKYQELEMKCGQLIQQSDSGETVEKALYTAKMQEANKLQERFNELMQTVKDKESKIQALHQQLIDNEQSLRTVESERNGFKKQVDHLTFQLHGIHTEHADIKAELAQLKLQKQAETGEQQKLREVNNHLTLRLQDSAFQVASLEEKMKGLVAVQQEQQGSQVIQSIQDHEHSQAQLRTLSHERDQAVLTAQHKHEENVRLHNQIQALTEKEMKMNRELNRLREHLIQIEDGYTREAVSAEEREKDLRSRLAVAEDKALSSTSAQHSANQHAVQQMDSIQQQLEFVCQQRDQAYVQLTSLQDENHMYSSSMSNLQMVLEQFQQEKDRLISDETERYVKEITRLKEQVIKLQADLKYNKDQLEEASDGLEAAARLSEQLDRKEEAIDALREEVQVREAALKIVEDELRHLKSRNDDRVDKLVIKNLFLGYFSTPHNKRHEVLRTIGGVLLFTADDFQKIEGGGAHAGGWVPGFLRFSGAGKTGSPPTSPARRSTIGAPMSRPVDNSFSQMFVKFLERESSPPPPTVRLPAEEMARNVQQKQKDAHNKPVFNPFTAPRHVAVSGSHSDSPVTGAHNSSHILISPGSPVTETIPTFAPPSQHSSTPPGSGRATPASTSSSAILKDVLNR